jgi:uncharacterized membrane protein YkoI
MKNATKYKIHKTTAIIVVPLLIMAIITGFFKANQKLYWEDGYKKKKHEANFTVDEDLCPIKTITKNIDSISKQKNKFEEISLRRENGKLFYKLSSVAKTKYLADAISGNIISPINENLAKEFAKQYVKDNKQITSCELIKNYKGRKAREAKPTYKISFKNSVHSEIYLDADTGDIIEDIDDNRTFGIWVMRLHEYDFFDSKKIVTIAMMFLSLSGIWIYKIRKKKKTSE